MSVLATIALANGSQAQISFDGSVLSDQILDGAGQAVGGLQTLDQDHAGNASIGGGNIINGPFEAIALPGGGFAVAYENDLQQGLGLEQDDISVAIADSTGHLIQKLFVATSVTDEGFSGNPRVTPVLAALAGGGVALAYTSFTSISPDSPSQPRLALANADGVYSNITLDAQPVAVTHANGDITLIFAGPGGNTQEVLDPNGAVLTARTAVAQFSANVAGGAALTHFAPTDQITLTNNDGSIASGTHSTLTYVVGSHTLVWDQDSEGPAPATQAAVLPTDVNAFTVANLASDFRPEVLKVISPTGGLDITWFDSDDSQTWDTLHATEDNLGRVLTYGSASDQGSKELFTFDADNSQAYTRFVDEDDAAGRVLTRSVLYDDGTSWTARFSYFGHDVVSYELDSFDTAGRQVGQSFFNADGTSLGH